MGLWNALQMLIQASDRHQMVLHSMSTCIFSLICPLPYCTDLPSKVPWGHIWPVWAGIRNTGISAAANHSLSSKPSNSTETSDNFSCPVLKGIPCRCGCFCSHPWLLAQEISLINGRWWNVTWRSRPNLPTQTSEANALMVAAAGFLTAQLSQNNEPQTLGFFTLLLFVLLP